MSSDASSPSDEAPASALEPTFLQARPGDPKTLSEESRKALRNLRQAGRRSNLLSPLAYNLTISHTHRYVWFRNAKVATRTILGFLKQQDADSQFLVLSRTRYPTTAFTDYFKFGFVRHPLGRFISAWQDKVINQNHFGFDPAERERMKNIETFAAWVAEQDLASLASADRHLVLQSRLIDLSQVDYLGRLESFDDDFRRVCRNVGLMWAEPESLNRSTQPEVTMKSVSTEVRSIVEEKYGLDYQILGY